MRWITAGIVVAGVICAIACGGGGGGAPRTTGASSREWYEGGTLSGKTALDWQAASPRDRLATCADIIAVARRDGWLNPTTAASISSMDDMRPLAAALRDYIDDAFKPATDPVVNQRVFATLQVSAIAADGLVVLGMVGEGPTDEEMMEFADAFFAPVVPRSVDVKEEETEKPDIPFSVDSAEYEDDEDVVFSTDAQRKRDEEARAEARFRTWHAAEGGFTVEAEYVKVTAGQVTLRNRDGTEITLPMDRLSQADQAWIKKPHSRED